MGADAGVLGLADPEAKFSEEGKTPLSSRYVCPTHVNCSGGSAGSAG